MVFWVYCILFFLLLRCSYKPYAVRSRSTPLSRRMRALWMPSLVSTSANTTPFAYTFELTPSSHETWWKISTVWRLIPTRVHDVDPKLQLNLRRVASDLSAQDDHLNVRNHCLHSFRTKRVYDCHATNCRRHLPQDVNYPNPKNPKKNAF